MPLSGIRRFARRITTPIRKRVEEDLETANSSRLTKTRPTRQRLTHMRHGAPAGHKGVKRLKRIKNPALLAAARGGEGHRPNA